MAPLSAVFMVPPAFADVPKPTDWLTAAGTLGLAVVTVITLITTIRITRTDRADAERRSQEDRADADRRLREERDAADRRLQAERDHTEKMRRDERRAVAVVGLLERIATLQHHLITVPFMHTDDPLEPAPEPGRPTIPFPAFRATWEAIYSLQHGARAEAVMLGHPGAAEQYRVLVNLVVSAALGAVSNDYRKRASVDLSRYATFVRCSLRNLAESGEILEPGPPRQPVLNRGPADTTGWLPHNIPAGFAEEIQQTDPADPLFVPAQ